MATFTDQFNRADVAPIGAPWDVVDAAGGTNAAIVDQAATNSPAAANEVRAFNTTTASETTSLHADAGVTSNSEAANSYIDIGVGGAYNAAWATQRAVAWARLEYRDFGERRFSLWYENPTDGTRTELETLTVASQGETTPGISGSVNYGGELGKVQGVRLIVTPVDSGIRLRGYLNQSDDDRPTIEATASADWPLSLPKEWWFGFGANGAVSTLAVTDYTGEDYTVTDRAPGPQRANYPTLADVRQKLENIYSRGTSSSNLDPMVYVDAIQFAYDEIINMMGDNAWFLIKVEEVAVAWDSSWRFAFPAYMKRIVRSERRGTNGEWVGWNAWFSHRNDNDQLVYQTHPSYTGDNSLTARVHYVPHHVRFQSDTDTVQFPWRYIELLVYGAAYRLAITDRSSQLQSSFQGRYVDLMAQFQRDQNRDSDQAVRVLRPRRQVHRPSRHWTGIYP